MEVGLRVNNIINNEKEGIINNLNRTDIENISSANLDKGKNNSNNIKNSKEYDRIDISKKARLAFKAKEIVFRLQDNYFEDEENISKYKEIVKEGKYLLRKVSEVVADKIRDKLMSNPVNELRKFPMSRKDYLAYKIADYLVN